MQTSFERFSKLFEKVERGLATVSGLVIYAMAIGVFLEVVTRKLGIGVPGVYEIVEKSMAITTFLALSWIQRNDRHIRLKGIFLDRSPSEFVRTLPWLIVSFAIFAFFSVAYVQATLASFRTGTHTMGIVQIPVWPFQSTVAFGCLILSVRLLVQMVAIIFYKQVLKETSPQEEVTV